MGNSTVKHAQNVPISVLPVPRGRSDAETEDFEGKGKGNLHTTLHTTQYISNHK